MEDMFELLDADGGGSLSVTAKLDRVVCKHLAQNTWFIEYQSGRFRIKTTVTWQPIVVFPVFSHTFSVCPSIMTDLSHCYLHSRLSIYI